MKFIKKKFLVFILLIFFMTLLSLTAVSAADYTVTGNSYDDIQNSVDVAGNNDRLLIGTGTYSSSGNAIEIDGKNITIQGQSNSNRAKLDGRGLYRTIIVRDDASLTLRYIDFVNGTSISYHALNIRGSLLIENCSFKNCYGDSGSAIYVFEDSNSAIIKDCTFINNHAANTGDNSYTVGGAVISQGSANFKVINCYFENNTALTYGGAIGLRNNGVGAEITNCTFVNNFAPDGGAIYALASATISGSTFRNNRATNNGGAIVTTGSNSLNIANSKFESNRAKNGGALYLTVLTRITGSSFSSNSATGNGGGLYTTGSSRSIISSSKFTSNSAKYGGGIYNNASLSISSSNFVSNKASANGGAIYANKNLNISGGNIKSNNANKGSGIYNIATLRISKVSFSSNVAKIYGIGLSAPSQVLQGKMLIVKAFVTKGDNILNYIFTTTSNVRIDSKTVIISNKMPNKVITIINGNKKVDKRTGNNGIATYKVATKKNKNKKYYNIKISSTFSQNNKKFTKSLTVKAVTKLSKPINKISNVKSNTPIYKNDMDRVVKNAKINVTSIDAKHVSYWNKKINKDTKLYPYIKYQYVVTINNSGKLSKKNIVVWEKSSTNIYFIKNSSLSEKFDEYLKDVKYVNGMLPKTSLKDKKIRKAVITILKNYNGELTSNIKAILIVKWMRNKISYDKYWNTKKGALSTLSSKKGNCVDQTHLAVALLRSVGVPTQYWNYGYVSLPTWGGGHVFGIAYINGTWFEFDPTSSSELQKKLNTVNNRKNGKKWINVNC